MCGICGMVDKSDKPLLQAMCDSLVHRGPDAEGTYLDDNAAIGVRRLSIIDLKTGDQPISNEDSTLWIVYNGEIYNYRELRELLRKKGHVFKTASDTEVVLHAYEEYGDDCVRHFNGDFSFAIWDSRRQELFAARDRVGVKPFYYWDNGRYFLFGSEIKAILQDPSFERKVNVLALYNYLSRLSVWGGDSIFQGIRRLEPAHTLRYKDGKLTKRKYWEPDFSSRLDLTEDDYAERIRVGFKDAVRRRLVSDVPLGVFLSGGVDSSSIVAMMSELSDQPVQTFSFGFEAGDTYAMNELDYARRVAQHFGTNHHEFVLDAKALIPHLPHLLWHFDEPFAGTLPQYFVAEQASRYVKVALQGAGGDELFGDYGRSWWVGRRLDGRVRQYRSLPEWAQNVVSVLAGGVRLVPPAGRLAYYRQRVREIIHHAASFGRLYADGKDAVFTTDQKAALCQPWVLDAVRERLTLPDLFARLFVASNARELMDQIFYVDMKTQLVDEYCYWSDLLTMAASVETRVPFLDHEFIELVISIPPIVRARCDNLKYLFTKAMASDLPVEVITRPKGGFSLPLDDWLRNGLRGLAEELLEEKRIQQQGYFNSNYVRQILAEHVSGTKDHTYQLWTLVVFELWHKIYIDDYAHTKSDVKPL